MLSQKNWFHLSAFARSGSCSRIDLNLLAITNDQKPWCVSNWVSFGRRWTR